MQVSLKDGPRQSSKKAEMAPKVAPKPKPNVLDKAPALKKVASKENTPSPPSSPSPALTNALTQRIEELVSELQKMKAIILKHEVRIRDLEKKVELKNDGLDNHAQPGSETNNNGDLLPDEV